MGVNFLIFLVFFVNRSTFSLIGNHKNAVVAYLFHEIIQNQHVFSIEVVVCQKICIFLRDL